MGRSRAEALVDRERTRTYWNVGRLIQKDILKNKDRAGYGDQIILKLSADFKMDDRLLYDALKLAKTYPILHARAKLNWSKQRRLLSLKDDSQREKIAAEAIKFGWNEQELQEKISAISEKVNKRLSKSQVKKVQNRIIPKKGLLRTYKIKKDLAGNLKFDLGFSSFFVLTEIQGKGLREEDIVKALTLDKIQKLPRATKADIYTYQAVVLRVVDGDTLWVDIDLGFKFSVVQKLRLRGIDCPEMNTKKGQKAKRFVEAIVKVSGSKVLITTTKPDKYDRYLTDLYAASESGKEIFLNQLLLERGLAELKSDYSSRDWGGE